MASSRTENITKIIVDTREKKLIKELNTVEVSFTIAQLDVGDIHIQNEHSSVIIERKTITDMIASIKDGRYKEQKTRLMANGNACMYIIEHDTILCKDKTLSGAYINTMLRDRIPICFTNGVSETVMLIVNIFFKMVDKPDRFIRESLSSYANCLQPKSKKISNITPNVCFVNQLSQIPRISTKTAQKIAEHHPNMRDLIMTLNGWENPIEYLQTFDGIGAGYAKTIVEYLGIVNDNVNANENVKEKHQMAVEDGCGVDDGCGASVDVIN